MKHRRPGLGRATHLVAVVVGELAAMLLVRPALLRVVLRRVLDLVLGHRDVDLLLVGVDPLDGAGRDHDLATEDPGPVSTTAAALPTSCVDSSIFPIEPSRASTSKSAS